MEQTVKILILEDLPADADLAEREISTTLEKCEFRRAENREEFVSALDEFGPDLIVADYQLPGFDGLTALKIALEKSPLTPVIMHTGSINEDTAVECMREGATDYVIKEHIKRLGPAVKRAHELALLKRESIASQQALQESEARFREIAENASDLIYRYDCSPGKKFSYVCPAFTVLTGYSPEEFYADPGIINIIVHPDDRHILKEITGGKIGAGETVVLRSERKDGSQLWTEHKIVYVLDKEREILAIEGIARDITDRKKAEKEVRTALEKAEQSDRLKTSFLNNLSHEIRTPLNAITGFSDILMDPGISEDQVKNCINIIRLSSSQLIRVVEDIIYISTVETGQLEVYETEFDLSHIVDRIIDRYRDRAGMKGIELSYFRDRQCRDIIVLSDAEKIEYVLSHLVDNAIKFSDKGTVEVRYRKDDDFLHFSVTDNGIGIEPQMQTDIFQRFHQTATEISQNRGGLGLGLPVSKAFVESLGGRIRVESVPGSGSTFSFSIPHKPVKAGSAEEKETFPSTTGKKILVAEDEETNFLLIREIIGSSGMEIVHAVNGSEAVEFAKEFEDFDLVLMDIKMPVMDGNTATRIIKNIRPSLPVIALTAHALPGDRERTLKAGFDDYLSKPFVQEELKEVIARYLR